MKMTSISKCLLVLTVLLSFHNVACAQDFRPGYVIPHEGDTVKGLVRYNPGKRSLRMVKFKATRHASKQTYTPDRLNGYGIYGDHHYISVTLPERKDEKIFARVLASGDITLLRTGKQFLMKADSIQNLPPPVRIRMTVGNSEMLRTDLPYVQVLNMTMAECGTVADQVGYNEKELTQLFDAFNLCKDRKYKPFRRKPIAQTGFNAFATYLYSDMFLKYDHASMRPSTFMGYGMGVDFSSPRINDKMFLSLDFAYADIFYQGSVDGPIGSYYRREDIFMDFTCLRFTGAFRYNLMEASRTPYFKIGFSQYSVLSHDIHSIVEEESRDGVVKTSEVPGSYDTKNPKGVYVGIGYQQTIKKKFRLFAEARYESMEGFIGTAIQSFSELKNYSIAIGVRLN